MKEEQADPAENWIELGNPPGDIVYIDETNSYEPPMTDELREMVRKALSKGRPPLKAPAPGTSHDAAPK